MRGQLHQGAIQVLGMERPSARRSSPFTKTGKFIAGTVLMMTMAIKFGEWSKDLMNSNPSLHQSITAHSRSRISPSLSVQRKQKSEPFPLRPRIKYILKLLAWAKLYMWHPALILYMKWISIAHLFQSKFHLWQRFYHETSKISIFLESDFHCWQVHYSNLCI